MKVRILLFTFFGFLQCAQAVEGVNLSAIIDLSGDHVSGDLNEARTFGLSTGINFQQSIYSNFDLDISGGFSLETGSSETVYGVGTFKPTNSLYLGHAELVYRPFSFSTLKAGAINQKYHNNPLFITSTPFIGAREILSYIMVNWTVELDLLQSIPSNHSLSKRLGSVNEGSARFFNEKVRIKGDGNVASLEASLGHFAFDQLSSSVAYESRLLGNTVNGFKNINNKFKYSFVGWNGDFSVDLKSIPGITMTLDSVWHLNTNAPDGKNLGYKAGPSVAWELNNIVYKLGIDTFENQSDSTIAYYSSKSYGHVNRKGNALSLNVNDNQNELSYGFKAVQADLIETAPLQAEDRILSIFLRKSYEIF